MRPIKAFLAPVAAALLSGCVATGALKQGLYQPPVAQAKARARVVVLRRPGPPAFIKHKELPLSWAKVDLSSYPVAAAAMLGSLYDDVSLAASSAQVRGADFVVLLSSDYPKTVGLTFQDSAGKVLASFSEPGFDVPKSTEADSLIVEFMIPPAFVISFGTLSVAFLSRAIDARDRIVAGVSKATAAALAALRARIAAAPALLPAAPAAPWTPSATCAAALTDAQAPPEVHLSCAQAAQGAGAWKDAAAHLKAYLARRPDAPDAANLRERLSDLQARP